MNGRSRRWRKAVIQRLVTLECELLDRPKTEARMALFSYIEGPLPPTFGIGLPSPANLEAKHQTTTASQSGEHGLTTVDACMADAAPSVDIPAPALIEHPSPA